MNSYQALVNTVAMPLFYMIAYNFGHMFNNKLDLFSKPRPMRIALVSKCLHGISDCPVFALYCKM